MDSAKPVSFRGCVKYLALLSDLYASLCYSSASCDPFSSSFWPLFLETVSSSPQDPFSSSFWPPFLETVSQSHFGMLM